MFPRKQCAVFAAWSVLLLFACGLAERAYVQSLRGVYLGALEVMRQAHERFPATLAATEHPLVVIGASHVRHAILPDVFDATYRGARGQRVQSISLGFNGLSGACLVELVEWVADELEDFGKSDLAVVEFNLLGATNKWTHMQAYASYIESCLSITAPARFFAREALRDPERAVRLLTRRWFAASSNPREIMTETRRELLAPPSWWPVPPKPDLIGSTWSTVLNSAATVWTSEARGGRVDLVAPSVELVEARRIQHTPEARAASANRRHQMAGIRELEFAPAAVADQIRATRTLQHVVKDVVVIVTPAEGQVIGESPRSKLNRAAVVEQIRHETGACVIDLYDSPLFGHDDFDDVDHLSPQGAEKYSRLLAGKLAEWDAAGRVGCAKLQ